MFTVVGIVKVYLSLSLVLVFILNSHSLNTISTYTLILLTLGQVDFDYRISCQIEIKKKNAKISFTKKNLPNLDSQGF